MLRVVKVGGSLLDYDRLVPALRTWLARQTPARHVLLAGGGRLADEIRRADSRFRLGEETAHWLSIGVLSVTARLLAALLPEARLVAGYEALRQQLARGSGSQGPPLWIFDVEDFLRHDEAHLAGRRLPANWQVTSDSIAARLAEVLPADELVLLKSTAPPPAATGHLAADAGYVDRFFPLASQRLPRVRCVNLLEDANR